MRYARRRFITLFGIGIIALNGCSSGHISKEQARRTADALLRKEYGMTDINSDGYDVRTYDRSGTWEIVYKAKELSVGGEATVNIDKRSGNVIRVTGAQ